MENRPHSREKRVSNSSGRVNKQSFGTNQRSSFSSGNRKKSGLNYSSVASHLIQNAVNNSHNNSSGSFSIGNKRKKRSLFDLLKIIIIALIVYYIVTSLFANQSSGTQDIVSNDDSYNPIQSVDTPTYDVDTSSEDVDLTVSSGARNKYTKILGNNNDEVTVMVYMIGTDLESQSGAGTKDINEMLYADLNDNINIIIQTGGCKRWNNSVISSSNIERYVIAGGKFNKLNPKIKNGPMTDKDTLSSFIQYSSSNFPANRYFLILWDHGGGSVTGYGYDEKYPQAGSMSPDIIAEALKDGGVKFDAVGFDACLMANLETAIAIEPYADYLIGSEETEPGCGWYYTNFLSELDKNTSIPTVKLGKKIIDDYIANASKQAYSMELTESIIDLGELVYNIQKPLSTFASSTSEKLKSDDYVKIAKARSNTKEFSKSSRLDQVDLIDLAKKFDVDGSDELVEAIKSAVKYNRTENISNSYGLSAYFPYSSLSKMNEMVAIYEKIDIDDDYADAVKSFASIASSGQIATQSSGYSNSSIFDVLMGNNYQGNNYTSSNDIYSLLSGALGGSNYSDYDYYGYGNEYGYGTYADLFGGGSSFVDSSSLGLISSFLGRDHLVDQSQLKISKKHNHNVVSLEESQWQLIDSVLLHMFVDDGEGYIDLGMDNVFDFTSEGDLIVDTDGTWLTINDHFISYYMVSDEYIDQNNYKIEGRVPAYLNGEKVDLIINFTQSDPYGIVLGAKSIYEESDSLSKGLIEINDGDKIEFIGNYYSYNGEFISEYRIGNPLIVDGQLELYNTRLENDYVYTYCFNDIYGNKLWTPKTEVK